MISFVRMALMSSLLVTVLLGGCATIQGLGSSDNSKSAIDSDAIKLRQTAKGAVLSFQDVVLFDTGQSDLRPESSPVLDKLANILITQTKSQIVIEGHTDNQGGAALNQQLSEARAKSVQLALLERRVESSRISIKGSGFSQPVAPNDTAQGRQRNRRVEILMVGENADTLMKGNAKSFDFTPELKNFFSSVGVTMKKTWNSVINSTMKP